MAQMPVGEGQQKSYAKDRAAIWRELDALRRGPKNTPSRALVHVAPTPPDSPLTGTLWYDTSDGD